MRPLKVCYVYHDQYPWDVRVEKILHSLAGAGIETFLVSRNRSGFPRREDIHELIHIHRLPRGFGRIDRAIMNFPAFFSPFWIKELCSTVRRFDIDLILVRDLPLAPTACLVGKFLGRPVFMDMAEDYPAMIQDTWTYRGPHFLDYLIRNPRVLAILERIVVRSLDGCFVVSQESQQRVQRLMGSATLPVWVIGNTPPAPSTDKPLPHPLRDRLDAHGGLKLLYVGGLEEARGLDTVLKALQLIVPKLKDILLVVVGEGTAGHTLKLLVRELGIERNVIFAGFIDHEHVPSIIEGADIGLVPHYVTKHTNSTIPNKFFDYMAQGKPVLVSNCKTLVDI